MNKALIFDLDGTLWDASAQVGESWDIVMKKYFGPNFSLTTEDAKKCMGKTMLEIARIITPPNTEEALAKRFTEECFYFERVYLKDHPGILFEGEMDTLVALSKTFDLYIVSNCQYGYIETFLPLVGEGLFKGYLCFDDTKREKGFTIKELIKRFSIGEACYIGDTSGDEVATRDAGLPFVFASYGFGQASSPDAIAISFADLPRALREIWPPKLGL